MALKVRTRIRLDPRQYERLKELAHERRQSLAKVLRTILDQALDLEGEAGSGKIRDARVAFVGSGRDAAGKRDVARHHDRYLYAACR